MTDILFWLLILVLVLAVLLVVAASLMLGRKLNDVEYQRAAGINGVRQIQAWINVRTHANRVLFGLVFVVICITLLSSDIPDAWRVLVARVLFAVTLACYTVSSALDWWDESRQVSILIEEESRKIEKSTP